MMTIDESTVAIVYEHFAERADAMIHFYKKEGKIAAKGRVRVYLSDNPDAFSGDDKKMWFELANPPDTLQQAMEKTASLLKKARNLSPLIGGATTEGPFILLRGEKETPEQFMEKFLGLPFVHHKKIDLS